MRYFLVNIDTDKDSFLNRLFQIYILKEAAYNAVIEDNANKQVHYSYILVPGYEYKDEYAEELEEYNKHLNLHYDISDVRTNSYNLSIGRFLVKNMKDKCTLEKLCESYRFRRSLIQELSDDMFSVTYTDGSICAKTKKTGWAIVRVGEEREDGLLDIVSQKKCSFIINSGSVENGTNNVGELTAIENATRNVSDKLFQVIISDCDYGMKSLRHYIHAWKKNNYKNGTVKNLELIKSIDKNIRTSNKIFLFKWTESHVGTDFNEICDTVAKNESGVNVTKSGVAELKARIVKIPKWEDEITESDTKGINYKNISDIDNYKKSAKEILGGYGRQSDNDIMDNSKEIYIDGKLVGYISFEEYNDMNGYDKVLGFGNFMILDRDKGYGTKVIKDLVNRYKNKFDLIYCFVDAKNSRAIKLYKKLGKVYDKNGPNDSGQYYVTFLDKK